MVDDPGSHRLERFAGQRLRMAEAIVAVRDRAPVAVVRPIFEMLGFDCGQAAVSEDIQVHCRGQGPSLYLIGGGPAHSPPGTCSRSRID
jgi:hypothetical protein